MNGHTLSKLLQEPYQQEGVLKTNLVQCLTHPRLYSSAYKVLFPSDREVMDGASFEPLIHRLAKHGGYVLEDDSVAVTDPMLTQQEPFREVSSFKSAIIDKLVIS